MHERNTVKELSENAACGFAAGFATGAVISGLELAKVQLQTDKNLKIRSMFTRKFARNNWKAFAHTAPTFGLLFGGACAIEFSTNAAIGALAEEKWGKTLGTFAGLTASAINCAAFLTAADHLMYRKNTGVGYLDTLRHFWGSNPRRLFTGYTPMIGREYLFGTSVLLTGPLLGEYIKQQRGSSNDRLLDAWWCFVGTLASGLVTTTASQPFDSIARQMQIMHHLSNGAILPRFYDAAKQLGVKGMYRGFIPRLGLATFGGASAGALFKLFKGPQKQEAIASEQHQQKTQP